MHGNGNQYYIKFKKSELKGEVDMKCVKGSHPLDGPFCPPERCGPNLCFDTMDAVPGSEDTLPMHVVIKADLCFFTKLARYCAESETVGEVELIAVRPAPDAKAKPKVLNDITFWNVLIRSVSWGGADLLYVEFYFTKHLETPYEIKKDGTINNEKTGFDRIEKVRL